MTRMLEIADASLAARREARRLGIAMAAMMPMIATTISSSISEKPFWPFFVCICFTVLLRRNLFRVKIPALSAIVSGYAQPRAISVTHGINKERANGLAPAHPRINAAICNEICVAAATRDARGIDA